MAGLCFLLCSCQIYRNNGRNLFESAAPTPTTSIGSGTFPVLDETQGSECWSQPKDEALWFPSKDQTSSKQYKVHFIDDQSIEVCLEASQSASPNSSP